MHISQFHTNPRNLTGGDGYTVDLGIVSVRDVIISGGRLIPAADGRCIKSVRYLHSGSLAPETLLMFLTPNTTGAGGLGYGKVGNGTIDTFGLGSGKTGLDDDGLIVCGIEDGQNIDCGPLIANPSLLSNYVPLLEWTPNTPRAQYDAILDINDHILMVDTGGNGITGDGPAPTFDNLTDGSVTWVDNDVIPGGAVHVIVEVVEGISPMPIYPASMEWIDPPADVVAGATMPDFTAVVKDNNGDPYVIQNQAFSFFYLSLIGEGAWGGGGGLNGDGVFDQGTGIVTFSGFSMTNPGTDYIFRVKLFPEMGIIADLFSPPFDATAP